MRLCSLRLALAAALVAILGRPASAQLAPNAPKDRPVNAALKCQLDAMYRAIAPLSAAARASFPAARQRFAAGLPPGHSLFATTRLHDADGREEQIFVMVDSITGPPNAGRIVGRIWSPVQLVRGYVYRQRVTFDVAELVDWMIARPDGTEEGNEVGKFLDTYRPPTSCTES